MTTDISLMGPHALASYHSRTLALESFGVDPQAITLYQAQDRSLAKTSRARRALMVQQEHSLITL